MLVLFFFSYSAFVIFVDKIMSRERNTRPLRSTAPLTNFVGGIQIWPTTVKTTKLKHKRYTYINKINSLNTKCKLLIINRTRKRLIVWKFVLKCVTNICYRMVKMRQNMRIELCWFKIPMYLLLERTKCQWSNDRWPLKLKRDEMIVCTVKVHSKMIFFFINENQTNALNK